MCTRKQESTPTNKSLLLAFCAENSGYNTILPSVKFFIIFLLDLKIIYYKFANSNGAIKI